MPSIESIDELDEVVDSFMQKLERRLGGKRREKRAFQCLKWTEDVARIQTYKLSSNSCFEQERFHQGDHPQMWFATPTPPIARHQAHWARHGDR